MPKEEPSLTPKTGFIVPKMLPLSAADQTVLAQLYLPLTGPLAYSLYAALQGVQRDSGPRETHATLLSSLNVDLPTVLTARQKLEATGLLRTYRQTDPSGEWLLYHLQAPMTAAQFLADDLLSVLLLDAVGESRFKQLAAMFTPATPDLSHATEVTANLLSVFHIDSEKVTHTPTVVQAVRQQVPATSATSVPSLATADFDWQVLGQILEQNYVNLDQVQASRQLIVTESRVYGISEVEMGKLISEVASLTTGKFDPQQLKLVIAKRYQRPSTPVSAAPTSAAAPAQSTVASKDKLTAAEQQLVTIAQNTTPYDFIEALKKEKHGFVTSGENRLVHDLVGRGVLSNAVINLLIYYLLQNRELTTINKNLLETIANDWQQHQITTPEAALAYLRQRQQPKPARSRRNSRPTRKEVVPDWAKKSAASGASAPASASSASMTTAEREKLAARIAKLSTNADKEG